MTTYLNYNNISANNDFSHTAFTFCCSCEKSNDFYDDSDFNFHDNFFKSCISNFFNDDTYKHRFSFLFHDESLNVEEPFFGNNLIFFQVYDNLRSYRKLLFLHLLPLISYVWLERPCVCLLTTVKTSPMIFLRTFQWMTFRVLMTSFFAGTFLMKFCISAASFFFYVLISKIFFIPIIRTIPTSITYTRNVLFNISRWCNTTATFFYIEPWIAEFPSSITTFTFASTIILAFAKFWISVRTTMLSSVTT